MAEIAALFGASFIAATLIPMSSEAALFLYLQLHPDRAVTGVAVATLGNTAGGMTTYLIGRLVPDRPVRKQAIDRLRRYGPALTFFAWLPVAGDALCVAAGWLRFNWIAVLGFMGAGRLARYLLVAVLSS